MVSVFAVILVALPLYTTVTWLKGAIFGNDPRKVMSVEPLQLRDQDKSGDLTPFAQPIVSVTFDDGWESIYSQAFPLLQKYGIPTTQYVLSSEMANPVYMSEKQIRSMQKAGHEIGSHTASHPNLTTIDDEDLERELRESHAELQRLFGPIRDFASPLGAYDDRTLAAISKVYRSQRNTIADPAQVDDKDVNVASNFNRGNIIAYTVRATTTIEDIQRLLDYTVRHNGWLVLTYHQVGKEVLSEGETYGVLREQLEEQLALLNRSSVRIAPLGAVLDAIDRNRK